MVTPMFAIENKNAIVVFKGVGLERLGEVVIVKKRLETKERPEDWEKDFVPEGAKKLLRKCMIDRVGYLIAEESLKRIFDQVDKWLTNSQIQTVVFYKAFVKHLHALMEPRYPISKLITKKRSFIGSKLVAETLRRTLIYAKGILKLSFVN